MILLKIFNVIPRVDINEEVNVKVIREHFMTISLINNVSSTGSYHSAFDTKRESKNLPSFMILHDI